MRHARGNAQKRGEDVVFVQVAEVHQQDVFVRWFYHLFLGLSPPSRFVFMSLELFTLYNEPP